METRIDMGLPKPPDAEGGTSPASPREHAASDENADLAGRVVAGRYRIERLLGAGGMGLVYLAEQEPLRRPVALKLLRAGRHASEEAMKRALREAQALSATPHDSIVQVLDAGHAETGEVFIALEYLEGRTLKQLLAETSFLPWRWAAHAISSVLSALEAIHARGFVHRDVKPSNCFCVTPGRPLAREPKMKLIDFGIARLLEPDPEDLITGDGCSIGTPAYAAPEQVRADGADARSDVYGTGVTLYELLTGKLPAYGERRGSAAGGLPAPSAVNPGAAIPPEVDALVLRALDPDPERRFPSAGAMRDELEAILAGEPPPPSASAPAAGDAAPALRGRRTPAAARDRHLAPGFEAQLARLHANVTRFWISGVLHGSLATARLAPQLRTREEAWIDGPGAVLESAPPAVIPGDRSTLELFEESGRRLLLLGEPGTGKTTQLLLLAEALLASGPRPVPVVLTLATWTESARSLDAWMADELRARYQIPASFAEEWIAKGLVLPLLDGLDEAPAHLRKACLDAINEAAQTANLPGIVVTSRTAEYEALHGRLRVNAAVRQHRLTREVAARAFAENPVLSGLSGAQRDQLLELAESPLALTLLAHVASITMQPDTFDPGAGKDQLPRLLDAYVEQMLLRAGKKKLPVDRRELLDILEQFAWSMRRNHCAVFQMDTLQPGWLEDPRHVGVYLVASRSAVAGLFGAGFILSFGLSPLRDQGFTPTLGFGVALAVTTTLAVGSVAALSAAWTMRRPARKRRTRRDHWALVAALAVAAAALDAALLGAWERHPLAAFMGFETGLVGLLISCPHTGIGERHGDIRPRDALRFSWAHALQLIPVGLILALVAFLGLREEREAFARYPLSVYMFLVALFLGGLRGKEVEAQAAQRGGIRRSMRSASLLALAGGAIPTILMSAHYGVFYGLCCGLTTSIPFWLWYGGVPVLQHGILRALLARERHAYCDERCLDAAADRTLLHRVGRGYLFVHPLLMAHLADRFAARRGAAKG